MSSRAKLVKTIDVTDPDSHGIVTLEVFKHQNGGMFAIDSSYLEQVVFGDDESSGSIYDPFVTMGEDPEELYLEE